MHVQRSTIVLFNIVEYKSAHRKKAHLVLPLPTRDEPDICPFIHPLSGRISGKFANRSIPTQPIHYKTLYLCVYLLIVGF